MKLYLGVDIGSVSINTVVMNEKKKVIDNRYDYCHGKPFSLLRDILQSIIKHYGSESLSCIATTGVIDSLTVAEYLG